MSLIKWICILAKAQQSKTPLKRLKEFQRYSFRLHFIWVEIWFEMIFVVNLFPNNSLPQISQHWFELFYTSAMVFWFLKNCIGNINHFDTFSRSLWLSLNHYSNSLRAVTVFTTPKAADRFFLRAFSCFACVSIFTSLIRNFSYTDICLQIFQPKMYCGWTIYIQFWNLLLTNQSKGHQNYVCYYAFVTFVVVKN